MQIIKHTMFIKCGEGASKTIYKRQVQKRDVAQIIPNNETMRPGIVHELKLQHLCACPNVVSVLQYHPNILVEYLPYALHKWIDIFQIQSTKHIINICLQISLALHKIHINKLVHKDVKICNILVSAKGNIIKVTDFGLACPENAQHTNIDKWRNYWSASPELRLTECLVTAKTDVFSFGLILYTLMSNRSPVKISNAIFKGDNSVKQHLEHATQSEFATPELNDILVQCLNVDPRHRPTSTGLVLCFKQMVEKTRRKPRRRAKTFIQS